MRGCLKLRGWFAYCLLGVLVLLWWGPAGVSAAGWAQRHHTTKRAAAKKSSGKAKTKKSSSTRRSTRSAHREPSKRRETTSKRRSSRHTVTGRRRTTHGRRVVRRRHVAKPTHESIRLKTAFVASAQLRPMAQQLNQMRSPAAYAGVLHYAETHPGDAAATAYLALGHAYMLDRRFDDAYLAFRHAAAAGQVLDDYADYLGAQAALQASHGEQAYALLNNFAQRHPDSIFRTNAPVLLANAYLQQGNPQGALEVLKPLMATALGSHADFRYALGRAYQLAGDNAQAAAVYRRIYLTLPLSYEAGQVQMQMMAMGVPLSAAERKVHADQLYNAKHYRQAGEEYHAIEKNEGELSQADRDALEIYVAVCDLKMHRLSRKEVERLPDTGDDSAALKLYLQSELARNENKQSEHDALVDQMLQRFPHSRWLEEALYSGGNMYLLKHDFENAIKDYLLLVKQFPRSTYAPSAHWRAAWLSYRMRKYADAARLMDEQIEQYPAGLEVPNALYWRGRIFEDEEQNYGQAANYYRTLAETYSNYYYADLARARLAVLKTAPKVEPAEALASVPELEIPELTDDLPEDDVHLIKAKLLANAALNEYIGPEVMAGEDAKEWGALAQAEIYASFGEYTRALQSMKHSKISFFTLPFDQVPMKYWHLLFPQPYWTSLVADSEQNGLDPYLVASLIRQESEFNAGAVSPANAYGLMQLLPSVGRELARKEKMHHFRTSELLDPTVNLRLGTMNLKLVLDRYNGQKEYALAAYNAGDVPVRRWQSDGDYKDIAEFVESIPYTETREYVQAILRNMTMYRRLYPRHGGEHGVVAEQGPAVNGAAMH